MAKSIFKWAAILLACLLVFLLIIGIAMHEPLPKSQPGPEADELAETMLEAIDIAAWDSTGFISWNFKGIHSFQWDRQRNWAEVNWDNHKVLVDLDEVQGIAFTKGKRVEGSKADKLIQKAWSHFCNDSFWLNAPAKAFDPGTERGLVQLDDGSEGLLITYLSGGVTPGDSYLWILDENKRPVSWKMWVKIIPFGGVEFSWEDWITLPTGAQLATLHHNSLIDLDITEITATRSITEVYPNQDPFEALATQND